MFKKSIAMPCLVLALLTLTLACHDIADPVIAVEPQLAKPVKPPPDADDSEPVLQEFWVYANPTTEHPGQQCIHFLASGSFLSMGENVAYDHFFNGFQDLYDHYEYYFVGGPPGVPTEFREDPELGMIGHEDVCFNGEYDSSGDIIKYLPDYLASSIDGTGYDPIALVLGVITEVKTHSSGVRFFRPEGVVVGGQTYDPAELEAVTSIWDHDGDGDGEADTYQHPTFYLTWKGAEAEANFFVEGLSVADATCTLEMGRGKNKDQILSTTVSLTVSFGYGVTSPAPDTLSYWGEGHMLVRPAGLDVQISEPVMTPSQNGSRTYSWTLDGYLGGDADVEFALDYLFGTGSDAARASVYNPALNGVFTTAGYSDAEDNAWDPVTNISTKIGDDKFPVAHSGFTTVTCSGPGT